MQEGPTAGKWLAMQDLRRYLLRAPLHAETNGPLSDLLGLLAQRVDEV